MEKNKDNLREAGLGVCAISYDSQEILQNFARRQKISIPLLSDPGSKIIRAFGILNTTVPPDQMAYGVPFPGSFLVNEKGVVIAKYFEEDYRERYSVGTILSHLSNSPLNIAQTHIEQDHLAIRTYASSDLAASGSRITLVIDITLQEKSHLYAPGAKGYLPLKWEITPSAVITDHLVDYPDSKTLYLPAIKESAPVYEGKVRLTRDLTLASSPRLLYTALGGKKEIVIAGTLQFQVCDDKICYLPQKIPLTWTIRIQDLDTQRAPEELRRDRPRAVSFLSTGVRSDVLAPSSSLRSGY